MGIGCSGVVAFGGGGVRGIGSSMIGVGVAGLGVGGQPWVKAMLLLVQINIAHSLPGQFGRLVIQHLVYDLLQA